MAISAETITAASPEAALPPAPVETPPADTGEPAVAGLPDEVLQIPAVQGILIGAPPATYAPADSKSPEIETMSRNEKQLFDAGIGGYVTKDKKNVVFFNALYLKPEELIKADEEGKLDSVAAPFDQLNADLAEAFEGAPAADGTAAPAPAVQSQPDAKVQNRLATARMENSAPGGPTSGPAPGAGRVLNNILKPAV